MESNQVILPDGRKLGYAEYGDPTGPALFYFHGGLSSRLEVFFSEAYCVAKKIRLIAVDRPGIGLSDYQPDRQLLHWPENIAFLAKTLNIERFSLLGWSMASLYVLACALRLSPCVIRAGIIGGAPLFENEKEIAKLGFKLDKILFSLIGRQSWGAFLLLTLLSYTPSILLKPMLKLQLSSKADRKVINETPLKQLAAISSQAFQHGAKGMIQEYKICKSVQTFPLEDISVETRFWHGEEDRLSPLESVRKMAARLPHGEFIIVPKTGHFLLYNHLDEILSWLVPSTNYEHS